MNIDKFIAKYSAESIDIQQLFDTAVFYNKVEDVKYLLQHYKKYNKKIYKQLNIFFSRCNN